MPKNQPRINEAKRKQVEKLKELFRKYPVIGVADLTSLPSRQLQSIRKKLKKELLIRNFKKRFIKIAILEFKAEKDLSSLEPFLKDSNPAMLFSNQDPFRLSGEIRSSKSKSRAKPGQRAPKDLIIEAGPTNFTPGPIIGELGQLGIIAAVEQGKIAIKKDKVLAKEGEEISAKAAELLAKIGVEPISICLNVLVFYDKGTLYKKDVLDVDEAEYIRRLIAAYREALSLSVSVEYPVKENIGKLIAKADNEVKAIKQKINL